MELTQDAVEYRSGSGSGPSSGQRTAVLDPPPHSNPR